jgi:hypothetical protein
VSDKIEPGDRVLWSYEGKWSGVDSSWIYSATYVGVRPNGKREVADVKLHSFESVDGFNKTLRIPKENVEISDDAELRLFNE